MYWMSDVAHWMSAYWTYGMSMTHWMTMSCHMCQVHIRSGHVHIRGGPICDISKSIISSPSDMYMTHVTWRIEWVTWRIEWVTYRIKSVTSIHELYDSSICVTYRVMCRHKMWDVTPSDRFSTHVTWLIRMWEMPKSHVWHEETCLFFTDLRGTLRNKNRDLFCLSLCTSVGLFRTLLVRGSLLTCCSS